MKAVFIVSVDHDSLKEIEKNTYRLCSDAIEEALKNNLDDEFVDAGISIIKISDVDE